MDKIKALEYFTLGFFFMIIICGNLLIFVGGTEQALTKIRILNFCKCFLSYYFINYCLHAIII